ncbi:unnamed protein product [Symbiodinium natans]|uniref:DUF2200 domain-containing protein n=1 Tax=Symbiodinium natans TaxID=878477 RepID=A0A812K3V7_9DINO|nr:unnamed protein product [Symbiodinium natans]
MGAKRAAAKPKSRAMKAVAKPKKQAMKKENKRTKAVAGDDDSKKEKEVKKILKIPFARVYPAYIAKVGKRGYAMAEVDQIIKWLTGYSQLKIHCHVTRRSDMETFFKEATKMNPNRRLITGTVCGVRVEEVENKTVRDIRYMDKLIDELAQGKPMEQVLRKP